MPRCRNRSGSCWPSSASGYGGAERLLVDMVAAGDHRAFDYEVAYVLDGRGRPGADHRRRRHPGPLARGRAAIWTSAGWRAFRRLLRRRAASTSCTSTCPTRRRWDGWWWPPSPPGRRPVDRLHRAQPVEQGGRRWSRPLNRATIGLDRSLIVVSQAAYDALPRALRPRARVIVHGVDLSRPTRLVARRHEVREQVRAELGVPDGDLLVRHRGQPAAGEGLRRAARRGPPGRRERHLPVRFAAAGQGARSRRWPSATPPPRPGRAVPVPRPSRRRPAAADRGRHLRAPLPPGGPARRASWRPPAWAPPSWPPRWAACPR